MLHLCLLYSNMLIKQPRGCVLKRKSHFSSATKTDKSDINLLDLITILVCILKYHEGPS